MVTYIVVLCIVTVVCCSASVCVTANAGGVCCDRGVLLCVRMGYCRLGSLCVLSVLCCCASVWVTVYWGVCVL